MTEAAVSAGHYHSDHWGNDYPRIFRTVTVFRPTGIFRTVTVFRPTEQDIQDRGRFFGEGHGRVVC